ncbi:SusD/RagB family nutrient-binding outer membrane lipoprotein [Nitritalea halalkaliphila]|uniref:SusD/RagB family nutrient-binding outer membrane lipoprotein n=1 Tax=Nitritalea halalkaliphila TaxID=590849 RepID=UPI0021CD44EB|nr:SusD/RagB family nutrient-binding outer membrane lipoprotein [Nitritalea halalkaliphila]
MKKWERFANSLRFKLLMRISGAVDVRAELQALWTAGDLILSPEDDAFFNFTAGQPNNFRLVTARVGDFNLFLMSETMEGILNRFQDPRAARYFRPTANNPQAFRGLRNGQDASQLSISIADFSLSGRIFREEGGAMRGQFLTSFEQKFFVAEAMQRGLLSGDPQPWYEAAVAEAFAFWQVPLPATYLTQGPAAFASAADKIELIMVQKWLAMPVNFYEGWTEHRRTGFPALLPVAASLNNGIMPRRMPYPATEDALNNANFQQAAAATDGNSFNVDVWWAKR